MKKKVKHTQKYRRVRFMQNSNRYLKFILKRVWMASDFSISGSGNRFKKIPLCVVEVFCLVLLTQVQ